MINGLSVISHTLNLSNNNVRTSSVVPEVADKNVKNLDKKQFEDEIGLTTVDCFQSHIKGSGMSE